MKTYIVELLLPDRRFSKKIRMEAEFFDVTRSGVLQFWVSGRKVAAYSEWLTVERSE